MFGVSLSDYDKRVYREELLDFLPKNIIDSHAHVYLKSMLPKKQKIYWPDRVAEDNSVEDLIQTYRDLFPNNNVTPVVFGMSGEKCSENNQYVCEVGKKYGFPTLYFTRYDLMEDQLYEQIVYGGFKGLKPYFTSCKPGVNPSEAEIFDFLPDRHLRVADRLGLTIVLHMSRRDRLKDKKNVNALMEIEQKYPNIKLIVAHVGRAYSLEDIGDAFSTLKTSKNILFDFSANTLSDAIKKCIDAVGVKRVVFGTDLPIAKMRMRRIVENGNYINIVPKGLYGDLSGESHMRETTKYDNMTVFVYEILRGFKKCAIELGLTKTDIEDVFYNNSSKLYNVNLKQKTLIQGE